MIFSMGNENYVRLKVLSVTLSAEEITTQLGIACDRSWKIGDMRGNTIIKEKNNGWIINSSLSKEAPLSAHIMNLLERLDHVADRIQDISMQADVEFSCVVYSEEIPELYFDKVTILKICALGGSLDIDLYRLTKAE